MSRNIVKIENLSFKYAKNLVLDGVSFDINKGDFIVLTGPNGGGKSTLARLIFGEIELQKGKISKNASISFAPQKLIPAKNMPITVGKFLEYIEEKYPFYEELYNAFNIKSIANLQLADLSGGQLQKVNLVANIRKNYDLIILDEPDQNLDFDSQEIFYKFFKSIHKNSSFIVISHDIHSFAAFEDVKFYCINQKIHCGTSFSTVHHSHYDCKGCNS
ncbi:ATP-binding cassette domain-containing protein [Candidatus Deianiraea vastatrix]|uniref:Zinc ABC transporter ATP-binding protein n=1 Tax=Candidatus Deianiraea vastatrix TaxID=2163644 RepID=A0A5B8XEU3_9RICK|nr:ATP-binding cassette domain-containing protein [Candidatus Deianiraea vastatrix]QED23828.1 Putative zinc ABC transporter ATP-binding protein [Candidatus Deianiraea vastatrix]